MAELGGGCKQPRGLGGIVHSGGERNIKNRKREHGIAVATVRREPVPLNGLALIQRHAEAVGVKLSKQRHGARIILLTDTPRRFREGREKIATLIGPVGHVRLLAASRRWGNHRDPGSRPWGWGWGLGLGCSRRSGGRRHGRRLGIKGNGCH